MIDLNLIINYNPSEYCILIENTNYIKFNRYHNKCELIKINSNY